MKVVIYVDEQEKKRIGCFYVPNDADEAWMEKNAPSLLYGAKLLAEEVNNRSES